MTRRLSADTTGCNCGSDHEHAALVARVDQSYLEDPARARERQARTATVLRARALAHGNGHAREATAG